jgi:hypothetical protein
VRVSTLDTIYATFTILSFHCARVFAQGLMDGHGELQDAFPYVEAPQLEVSQAFHGPCRRVRRDRERESDTPPIEQCGNRGWGPY